MDEPAVWGGIWLAAAAVLGVGEMLTAGTFWLMPFAVAAVPAAIVSFVGAPVAVGWLVFLAVSVAAFLGLRPLAARLDIDVPTIPGIGSNRLIGHEAVVTVAIPAGSDGTGRVRIGGEIWNAMSRDDIALPEGTDVEVVEVRGTRVVVHPTPDSELGRYL